jgi:hypothetical protein
MTEIPSYLMDLVSLQALLSEASQTVGAMLPGDDCPSQPQLLQ